ncbi:hypothetical protein THZG08_240089 [Vibrio owensii]|nr:hypothetical protein THZG08_240089 [Vibrio owensii]CAH1562845.1 hypothetical protein THOA03_240089 [Vibrio owensii]
MEVRWVQIAMVAKQILAFYFQLLLKTEGKKSGKLILSSIYTFNVLTIESIKTPWVLYG